MLSSTELLALEAFRHAATRVPAYRKILVGAGVRADEIRSLSDFQRLPVLNKATTFQQFDVEELCVDGVLGDLGTLLTSSGHSGVFAFGVTNRHALDATTQWVDDSLDLIFGVRSQRSLLVNCLPMGVKVPTRACALAEVSVRPDMAVSLVRNFGHHFSQVILLGEAAFIKLMLETGERSGVNWRDYRVHVILGEEPLAENARTYLASMLGHDFRRPEHGVIFSSMGVAELGLNLFFEVPPMGPLIALRRLLHSDSQLREQVLGPTRWVPSLFTFDPRRIVVEFDVLGRLILTTLDLQLRIPLIRYATGDRGAFVQLPSSMREVLEQHGIPWDVIEGIPIVAIRGRGDYASAGGARVYPEEVKEGLYLNPALAKVATGNFRLISGTSSVEIRIQLTPGATRTPEVEAAFSRAISNYVLAPYTVSCHAFEDFRGGMTLDYERKFHYIEN